MAEVSRHCSQRQPSFGDLTRIHANGTEGVGFDFLARMDWVCELEVTLRYLCPALVLPFRSTILFSSLIALTAYVPDTFNFNRARLSLVLEVPSRLDFERNILDSNLYRRNKKKKKEKINLAALG